jgi:hypothetical protein
MSSRRSKQFWKRMIQTYGAQLIKFYGETPPKDWAVLVDSIDDSQLDQTMIQIRNNHVKYPPTLPEFEALVPRRSIFLEKPLPDRLADHVLKTFRLCEHQSCKPWSYFGEKVMGAGGRPEHTISGVVIPECNDCKKSSHRVLVEELQHENFN